MTKVCQHRFNRHVRGAFGVRGQVCDFCGMSDVWAAARWRFIRVATTKRKKPKGPKR